MAVSASPLTPTLATAAAAVAGFSLGVAVSRWWASGSLKRIQAHMKQLGVCRAAEPAAAVSIEAWGGRAFPVGSSDTALVLIDMQTDFLSPSGRVGKHYDEARVTRMAKTIDKVEELLKAAREAGLTIAHSRSHRYGAHVLSELVEPLDETYALHPRLRELPGEIVVDKFTFGAFASTELETRLRERGVTRILLAGVLTNVCIMATAVQAVDRLFRVCLVEDACGAFSDEWHQKAVSLIYEPQVDPQAHHHSIGLYFGEVASLQSVKAALAKLD